MLYRLSSDYVLRSERLNYRAFRSSDKHDMIAIQSNPEMVKYTPDDAWRGEQDWNNFFNFASVFYDEEKEWKPDWFRFFFAIRENGCDRVIGYCGLGAPEYDRRVTEVFYGITPEKQGHGYATEAAKAMLRFGFDELSLSEIIGFREKDNPASGRVLEKAGLKLAGRVENVAPEFAYFEGEPLYCITREQYIC